MFQSPIRSRAHILIDSDRFMGWLGQWSQSHLKGFCQTIAGFLSCGQSPHIFTRKPCPAASDPEFGQYDRMGSILPIDMAIKGASDYQKLVRSYHFDYFELFYAYRPDFVTLHNAAVRASFYFQESRYQLNHPNRLHPVFLPV